MGNSIKYTTGSESNSLAKGNFRIGTGDVGKGASSVTGFYKATEPPSGGYRVYLYNDGLSGDIAYYTATNDSELISFTNNLVGTSFTTAQECLAYYSTQTDKVCFNREYEPIVTDGLILNLDAGFTPSYPTSGTTWTDLSGNANNCTLVNGPTYSTSQGGGIQFDATDDYATIPDSNSLDLTELTISLWFNRGSILTLTNGDGENLFLKGISTNDEYCPAVTLLGPTGGGRYAWISQPSSVSYSFIEPPSQVLFANQWYNLVFTHVSTNTPVAYLNGVKQTNWTTTNPTNPLIPNTLNATICGDQYRSTKRATFNGIMSIVQLYNRALSETEVLQNWNALKGRFGL